MKEEAKEFYIYQYLITTNTIESPFFTNWFDPENHFNMNEGMVVYDLRNAKFTTDGTQWQPINEDHL